MAEVITRFAPSPTGYLHAGNYRTAIFAYLFARGQGGKFIVRIEDTDRVRSKMEYEDNIHETIAWLGILPDANYRQSGFAERHKEELRRLINEGRAYVSKEEGGERTEVIRFINPKTSLTFTDVIRGPITFDTTELGDFVIARSLDEPLFHLAVVVDDADEGVSHVIRGEDHISNTPRQILIQKALGYPTPAYAHLPLVLGSDRTKLSKRRGAKALTQYRDEGYLPEALINYLALLGWHPEGEQEIFTVSELVEQFNLARIQKGAGIFDEVKLRWFNHEHLKRLPDDVYISRLTTFAGKEVDSRLVPLLRERAATLKEAAEALEGELSFAGGAVYDPSLLLQGGKIEPADASKHLHEVARLLDGISDESFSAEAAKAAVWEYATQAGRGAVLWPMRVALSGSEKSPDPFTIAGFLGKKEALERIARAAQAL